MNLTIRQLKEWKHSFETVHLLSLNLPMDHSTMAASWMASLQALASSLSMMTHMDAKSSRFTLVTSRKEKLASMESWSSTRERGVTLGNGMMESITVKDSSKGNGFLSRNPASKSLSSTMASGCKVTCQASASLSGPQVTHTRESGWLTDATDRARSATTWAVCARLASGKWASMLLKIDFDFDLGLTI